MATLEDFNQESIRRCIAQGYNPTRYLGMTANQPLREVIRQIVVNGDELTSGFQRMRRLGLLDWTSEAAVPMFPGEFAQATRAAAQWRLNQAGWTGHGRECLEWVAHH
jgi:hypothetical protein